MTNRIVYKMGIQPKKFVRKTIILGMALKISYKVRKKLAPRSEEEVGISLRITESNRIDYLLTGKGACD